eukprot:scaffold5320_cov138-Isochrysis_galbana.AAC.3
MAYIASTEEDPPWPWLLLPSHPPLPCLHTHECVKGLTDLLFNNTLPEREINRIKRRTIRRPRRDAQGGGGRRAPCGQGRDDQGSSARLSCSASLTHSTATRPLAKRCVARRLHSTITATLPSSTFATSGTLVTPHRRRRATLHSPTKDRDTACAPAALTELDCDAFRKFFTDLETANDRLEGTDHHYKDATLIEKTIEAIAYKTTTRLPPKRTSDGKAQFSSVLARKTHLELPGVMRSPKPPAEHRSRR